MGAGIQMGYSIRPIIKAEAVEAMVIRTLGSGSNGIGYYMYQGGSTPHRDGDNAFLAMRLREFLRFLMILWHHWVNLDKKEPAIGH